MYVDALLNSGDEDAYDWAICGVGVMPGDARMRDALKTQDGLYTLVLKDSDGTWEPRVIGSIVDYLLRSGRPRGGDRADGVGATRIVSLTVTEGGYNVHPVTGEFDATNPAVLPTSSRARPRGRRSGWSPRRCAGGAPAGSSRSP